MTNNPSLSGERRDLLEALTIHRQFLRDAATIEAWQSGFRLGDDETLERVLAEYERVAAATDQLVSELDDLDRSFPLPPAPWFPPGAERSVRRTIVHIIAETAQHAGHADIIREAIDDTKSMG